jgi:hypothetical protein
MGRYEILRSAQDDKMASRRVLKFKIRLIGNDYLPHDQKFATLFDVIGRKGAERAT